MQELGIGLNTLCITKVRKEAKATVRLGVTNTKKQTHCLICTLPSGIWVASYLVGGGSDW